MLDIQVLNLKIVSEMVLLLVMKKRTDPRWRNRPEMGLVVCAVVLVVCAVVAEEKAEFFNEKLLAMDKVFYKVFRPFGFQVFQHLSDVFIFNRRVGVLQCYYKVI